MEINSELIKKNLSIISKIENELKQNKDLYGHILLEISKLNIQTYILYCPGIRLTTNTCRALIDIHYSVIKLIKTSFFGIRRGKLKIKNVVDLAAALKSNVYSNPCKNIERCRECSQYLIRHNNAKYCPDCQTFDGKIYLFKDEEADDDIKRNKSNISKHFETTLNKIYGSVDEKNIPPQEAIDKLREILIIRKFDIHQQVHYTQALMTQLKKIGTINYSGGKYDFKKQKAYVNYILQKLYPELVIPKLTSCERTILENTFLEIASEFQQLYPTFYSSSYQYTIHRILHMLFPKSTGIRTLLRFIYLQKPTSFGTKDERLNNINNNIKCFQFFAYLPSDIYINIRHYIIPQC